MPRMHFLRTLLSLTACLTIALTGFAQEPAPTVARAPQRPNPYAVHQLPIGQRRIGARLTTSPKPFPPILGVPGIFSSGGSFAQSVAVGDLNGDGKLDIVVGNQCLTTSTNCSGSSGGLVGVLLGNGDGTYKPAVTYASGGFDAAAVAVADVNGDGKLDIVVVNSCSTNTCSSEASTVSVLFGNGNGTFKTAVTYASGGDFAAGLAVADVNGDHKPDLLVVNGSEGTIGVLLNKGNGTFKPAVTYLAGGLNNAVAIAVGDVNGDGKPDLAVANYNSDSVSVLLGNGNGTFQTAVPFATGAGNPQSVALGDVNGDGKLDLVVANCAIGDGACGEFGEPGSVDVILGNGDGTFQNPTAYNSGGEIAFSVALADVNRDGKLDMIVADACAINSECTEPGGIAVFLGNGDGTFQASVMYGAGGGDFYQLESLGPGYTSAVVVADVTGNGKADLVAVNGGIASTAAVLLGNGNGTFQSWAIHNAGGYGGASPTVADLNGDGKLDLVSGDGCNPPGDFGACDFISNGPGAVGVLLGDGKGGFAGVVTYGSGGYLAGQPAVADVNGDGIADVLVTNACSDFNCASDGTVAVLLGIGDGTLKPAVVYDAGGLFPTSVAVADVNGDGHPDLIVTSTNINSGTGDVAVLFGNGDGTFKTPVVFASGGFGNPSGIAVRDLNGDHLPDLVVANPCIDSACQNGAAVGVLLGKAPGKFYPVVVYGSGGQYATSIALGDVNGDGRLDLLVGNGILNGTNNNVGVLLGIGDGTFQAAVSTPVVPFVGQIALADFNHDGRLDIAASGGSLLLGNGDGTFKPPISLVDSGRSVAVGDFNGDGRPDLAIGNYVSVDVLLNITPKR
jgi:FG-GAP-like repeat/FG-GAP repeat